MIKVTIEKIESRIRQTESIGDENKEELLDLFATLKSEVADLARTHEEDAESIAIFTEVSAREATRQQTNPRLLRLAIDGLSSSVEEFETSHPKLVQNVDSICRMLAAIGL